MRHVLLLLAALIGLIAVYTAFPGRFGAAGLAALTYVLGSHVSWHGK
jgi:hypothetical protein